MTDIDPITFEVVKHRLWQINDEQSVAIKTISASPIVVEGNDFNVGLFTADGQLVTAGIGSLVHVGTMAVAVQSIIARAGSILDGDVFMTNDPFLGALHQNDLVVASPLFHDGEIVLWVGNVLHHPDVGGIDEGSFCINARTLYQDPPRYFLKIVDQGEMVVEAEYTFVTNSRLPDMVALDLRAQIGAVNVAKERLAILFRQRGVDLVDAVMERSIDLAERQVRDLIARLPRGSWNGTAYMDGVRVGSDLIAEVHLTLTADSETLSFDYTGSSPQVDAAVNCTIHGCIAGSTVPLYSFLCQGDIDWNDGLRRCVEVTAPEGTVVNAVFPAPVSISTVGFRWLVTVAATQAVARMLNESDEFRDRACASWNSSANCNNLFGVTDDGRRVGMLLSDHRGGGAGARSFDDGFSHAGNVTSYASSLSNVESTEWKLPVLYLFRHQLTDSGGVGKYRGGLSSAAALVPFGIDEMVFKSTNTAGTDQSNAHGLAGAYPGAGSQVGIVRGSDLWKELETQGLPSDIRELAGRVAYQPSKSDGILTPDDIFVFFPAGGGGYGDPLDREPDRVALDVAERCVSAERASDSYGVVIGDNGTADRAATARLRDEMRTVRREAAPLPDANLERGDGAAPGPCPDCGHDGLVRGLAPLSKAGPWLALRWGGVSPNFSLEEIICAGCGRLRAVREVRQDTKQAP